jgi:hypothetical protein
VWASDGQGARMGFSCSNVFACNMRLQQNTVFLRDASVSQSSQREGKLFGGKRFMNGASGIPARNMKKISRLPRRQSTMTRIRRTPSSFDIIGQIAQTTS